MKHIVLSRSAHVGSLAHKLPKHHAKLTDEGHQQTRSVKRQLAEKLGFNWRPEMVFNSDSYSSQETSTGIYGSLSPDQPVKRRVIPSLCKHPNQQGQDLLNEMFEDLGCVALEVYFDKYGRAGEKGYAIMDLAQTSHAQIQKMCETTTTTSIAVVGQPVLLLALTYFLTNNTWWWYQNLSECETIVLDMSTREKLHILPEAVR